MKELRKKSASLRISRVGCPREVNQMMFVDDTDLVTKSSEKQNELVSKFSKVCQRRKWKINVERSWVMRLITSEGQKQLKVRLNVEKLEKVKKHSST